MLQPPCRFRFTEKAFARIHQFIARKFLAQCHGLDRHHPANFRVFAKVHHAHGALAELFVDLVAAQHRLLYRATVKQHGATRMRTATTEHHGF